MAKSQLKVTLVNGKGVAALIQHISEKIKNIEKLKPSLSAANQLRANTAISTLNSLKDESYQFL